MMWSASSDLLMNAAGMKPSSEHKPLIDHGRSSSATQEEVYLLPKAVTPWYIGSEIAEIMTSKWQQKQIHRWNHPGGEQRECPDHQKRSQWSVQRFRNLYRAWWKHEKQYEYCLGKAKVMKATIMASALKRNETDIFHHSRTSHIAHRWEE